MKEWFRKNIFGGSKAIEEKPKPKRTTNEYDHLTETIEYSLDGQFRAMWLKWKDGERGHSVELEVKDPDSINWFQTFRANYAPDNTLHSISFDTLKRGSPSTIVETYYDADGKKSAAGIYKWHISLDYMGIAETTPQAIDQLGLFYFDEAPEQIDVIETLKHFQKQLIVGDFSRPLLFPKSDNL